MFRQPWCHLTASGKIAGKAVFLRARRPPVEAPQQPNGQLALPRDPAAQPGSSSK
jgi:hypothetical protein